MMFDYLQLDAYLGRCHGRFIPRVALVHKSDLHGFLHHGLHRLG